MKQIRTIRTDYMKNEFIDQPKPYYAEKKSTDPVSPFGPITRL